jgi:hypothetical protein
MEHIKKIIINDIEKIEGWCTIEKALYVVDFIEKNSIRTYIELGVFGGRSLLPVALAIKHIHGIGGDIIGIDPWEIQPCLEGENAKENDAWWASIDLDKMYSYTQNLLKMYNVDDIVRLKRTSSNDYVNNIGSQSIDLLHQDSNHSEFTSCREVDQYYDKVKINGFWIFDDTDWETTQKAQKKLVAKGYECVHDAVHWKIFKRIQLVS